MKVLVINAGSSSLKYQLIDMETEKVLAADIACVDVGEYEHVCVTRHLRIRRFKLPHFGSNRRVKLKFAVQS